MMAFKKNFVASIKCGGKILRENGEYVTLPFGSEYSILLKNLHTRKALINIDIDGTRVFSNLVVYPNQTAELKRYQNKDNRFKFIEKTQEISDYRGDKIDDGFIRVEFKFEKELPVYREEIVRTREYRWDDYVHEPYRRITYGSNSNGYSSIAYNALAHSGDCLTFVASSAPIMKSVSDAGITVPGQASGQTFSSATIGELEPNSEVIIIRLSGKKGGAIVEQPITVNTKLKCPTCGRQNKSNSRFCNNCGTSLE